MVNDRGADGLYVPKKQRYFRFADICPETSGLWKIREFALTNHPRVRARIGAGFAVESGALGPRSGRVVKGRQGPVSPRPGRPRPASARVPD